LQISDQTLPVSRKAQREQERDNAATRRKENEAAKKSELNGASKRKRETADELDSKLKEFLEVMQPASKTKTWTAAVDEEGMGEPPSKIQAIEIPGAQSDEEYEAVPKRQRKTTPPKASDIATSTTVQSEAIDTPVTTEVALPDTVAAATDDDWLRNRTSRLLDLVDPESIEAVGSGKSAPAQDVPESKSVEQTLLEKEPLPEGDVFAAEEPIDKPDPILDEISKNGRLFVRNLPYTATEDELRNHFQRFGALEEVCLSKPPLFSLLCNMMNIQIGTAYATHVM
jgi:multiple RNA-binding domain-containing protein 1